MTPCDEGAPGWWSPSGQVWAGTGLWALWVLFRHAQRLILLARLHAEDVWTLWPGRVPVGMLVFPSVGVLLVGAWWLVRWMDRDPRAARVGPWLGLAYGVWRVIERQVLSTPVFARPRWPFDLGWTVLGVLLWWLFVYGSEDALCDAPGEAEPEHDFTTIEPLKEAS